MFCVNTTLREWECERPPRRAAVSAFGVGGTNAHVVLEEAIEAPRLTHDQDEQLFILSARTPSALSRSAANLASYLDENPSLQLRDVAYTLQVGRKAHRHRAYVSATSREVLSSALREQAWRAQPAGASPAASAIFLFPGQGTQRVNMGRRLYGTYARFREALDKCASILAPLLNCDIKDILYPALATSAELQAADQRLLARTDLAQPLLFAIEYSLATLLRSCGIQPAAMAGHSLGEYVAACLAGVFELQDALRLVVARGRLMQDTAPGKMIAVPLSQADAQQLLDGTRCELAAVNSPTQVTIAGSAADIDDIAASLAANGITARVVNASHAFHSRLMEPILSEFEACFATIKLAPAKIPFVSNVTGTWITPQQATDPRYWSRHLRSQVRFAACLDVLAQRNGEAFVEVGPGQTMSALCKRHKAIDTAAVVGCMAANDNEVHGLLNTLGTLWCRGAVINWETLHDKAQPGRVPLPTYPFERQRHWIDEASYQSVAPGAARSATVAKCASLDNWFYLPTWKRMPLLSPPAAPKAGVWLVFMDRCGLAERIVEAIVAVGALRIIQVAAGEHFASDSADRYTIDPDSEDDYHALIAAIDLASDVVLRIVHLWSVDRAPRGELSMAQFFDAQVVGFSSLCYLTRAAAAARLVIPIRLIAVATGLHAVTGEESLAPEKATLLGLCKVLPQEERQLECICVDLDIATSTVDLRALAQSVVTECRAGNPGAVVALRHRSRWVQEFVQVDLATVAGNAPLVRRGDVFVITGGLGNIGFAFARMLAERFAAKLVLVNRTQLPPRSAWDEWLATHDAAESVCRRIARLRELESLGAEYLFVDADATDARAMEGVFAEAKRQYGAVDGFIHTAADMTDLFISLHELTSYQFASHCHAKVAGLLAVHEVLEREGVRLCMVTSSLSSILGGLGFAAYAAANACVDALVEAFDERGAVRWIGVNWDVWSFGAQDAFTRPSTAEAGLAGPLEGMTAQEGALACDRILRAAPGNRVLVAVSDLQARLDRWVNLRQTLPADEQATSATPASQRESRRRPQLATEFVAPAGDVEIELAGLLKELLGVDAGVQDSFFELGGDSLIATQVVARVRARHGAALSLRDFYTAPTIAAAAQKIESAKRVALLQQPRELTASHRRVEEA